MEIKHVRIAKHNPGGINTTTIVVHFLEYRRSPEAFFKTFLDEHFDGNLTIIGDKAKLLAAPREAPVVLWHLLVSRILWRDGSWLMEPGRLDQLKPWHVICTEDFRQRICDTVARTPRRLKISVRRSKWIAIPLETAVEAASAFFPLLHLSPFSPVSSFSSSSPPPLLPPSPLSPTSP